MDRLKKIGFSKLTTLNDALNLLKNFIRVNSSEEIDVKLALNRILAIDIESELDIPPFERAAMDGYALKATNTFEASPKNPKFIKLKGKIEIGETSDITLREGEAVRISTGAAIPEGADAVIKIEETEIEGDLVKIIASVGPGKNIAKKGEDIRKGTRILTKGCDLKPEHIALLSSIGFSKVKVAKQTTVSIFATGDELLEPGESIKPSKIYNSNTPMISSLVKLYGGLVIRQSTLKDDIIHIEQALRDAEKDSQVIIFTGGTSVGTKDFLPDIMERIGNILVHGIAMRPGTPILIGSFKKSIIFCLPGTPVAAYVGFLTVAGPALRSYMGCIRIDPRIKLFTTISKDVPVSTMGYINHLRVKLEKRESELLAIPIRLKGSGIISSLTESDGIIEIPPYKEGLKQGERFLVKLHPK